MIVSGIGELSVTADIHGMTAEDAKSELQKLLTRLPQKTEELLVIHGYNGGQVLRIQSKLLSLNAGQTRILLKK